jgi:hypothetical protein
MIDETAKKFAELTCSLSRECSRKEEFFARCYNLTPAELRLLMLFGEKSCLSITGFVGKSCPHSGENNAYFNIS